MGSVRITGPGLDSLGTEAEWTNPGPEEAQQKAGAGAAGKGGGAGALIPGAPSPPGVSRAPLPKPTGALRLRGGSHVRI